MNDPQDTPEIRIELFRLAFEMAKQAVEAKIWDTKTGLAFLEMVREYLEFGQVAVVQKLLSED